jgi:tRNA(Arg) A34 adenosine deaminase TadA
MANSLNREALELCVKLAREALEAGDAPFGSVLVSGTGKILQHDRNRTVTGEKGDMKPDATLHPEFTLAHWAMLNLDAEERAKASVYTSGEHCAMCSAAHAYCGLGPIVYITSTAQYSRWMDEAGAGQRKVLKNLAINDVAPGIQVQGPIEGLDEQVKALHAQRWSRRG